MSDSVRPRAQALSARIYDTVTAMVQDGYCRDEIEGKIIPLLISFVQGETMSDTITKVDYRCACKVGGGPSLKLSTLEPCALHKHFINKAVLESCEVLLQALTTIQASFDSEGPVDVIRETAREALDAFEKKQRGEA